MFLHFDDDDHWVNSTTSDVDLETFAAHEIGHTLGLAHSDGPSALMYPSYSGPHRSLGADDIAGAQKLYGLASSPPPAPDVPSNQQPPPSNGQDTDLIPQTLTIHHQYSSWFITDVQFYNTPAFCS